ncbi:hypothetical protein AaE_010066 [Aphanomyces astaci]|uniref:Nascent polypeptide-associated complex subunit alpha-like UBA domain-containing protein n=1 Tax=Aphanomyces astaci TaxID=112090 RepID=A0A6A5A396_APHAT|nr:hypothetical protein AaE_010066 [Aphanomyces astaci]
MHVLRSLSVLKRRGVVPRSKLQEYKDMLITRHPALVAMVHEAARKNQDLAEYLLAQSTRDVPVVVPTQEAVAIDALDVSILRAQFGIDEAEAIRVLEESRGDFVTAILAVDLQDRLA